MWRWGVIEVSIIELLGVQKIKGDTGYSSHSLTKVLPVLPVLPVLGTKFDIPQREYVHTSL